MDVSILKSELETYERRRETLLVQAEGKWVLIRGDQVVGTFDTNMDAVADGYRRFGNVPFMVKQILRVETPENFISNQIGIQAPSFTVRLPNLQAIGPSVDLVLGVAPAAQQALQQAKQAVPNPIRVTSMIDTVASRTVIQQGLAGRLGIRPVGVVNITTPSSQNTPALEYLVQLGFPNNVSFLTVAVEAPLKGQHIQCLIGRDVLAQAVLVYVGYDHSFTLSF